MKLESELRELMRKYMERQRAAKGYDDYLHRKVEAGRVSVRTGNGRSNEDVESEFAKRRAKVLGRASES